MTKFSTNANLHIQFLLFFCSPITLIILKLYCLAITSTELCGLVGKKASLFLSIMFGVSKSQRKKDGQGFAKP